MSVRVGVSGWSYKSWSESFFPHDLPKKRQLEHVTRVFNAVEVNGSFYSLQKPETYRRWYETAPAGFVYALKGSRFITHNKKLGEVEVPLANFFVSGVLRLEEKLGPIVWQLPDNQRFDEDRVGRFLALLPRDTKAAASLARKHESRLSGRSWLEPGRKRFLRHVLEARSESFLVPELVRLLRRHSVALAVSDSADWPRFEDVTAGFLYLRLHGARQTYASRYTDRELDDWARHIRVWAAGGQPADARRITDLRPARRKTRDVYVFLDNDQQAHAPHDAVRLAERLGLDTSAAE